MIQLPICTKLLPYYEINEKFVEWPVIKELSYISKNNVLGATYFTVKIFQIKYGLAFQNRIYSCTQIDAYGNMA